MDGFSVERAFGNHIEQRDKLGFPNGDMPDGSPNLGLIESLSQMKAYKKEMDENSKVQISTVNLAYDSSPLIPTSGGFLSPGKLYGKLT